MATYTPRQRVMQALNHEEPDRVPIDFGSTYMTSITLPPYLALEKALGLSPQPPRFHTPLSKIVLPREEILRRFRADTRGVPRPDAPATWRNRVQDDGTILDEFGVVWRLRAVPTLSSREAPSRAIPRWPTCRRFRGPTIRRMPGGSPVAARWHGICTRRRTMPSWLPFPVGSSRGLSSCGVSRDGSLTLLLTPGSPRR